jgi:hypothetical protein
MNPIIRIGEIILIVGSLLWFGWMVYTAVSKGIKAEQGNMKEKEEPKEQ